MNTDGRYELVNIDEILQLVSTVNTTAGIKQLVNTIVIKQLVKTVGR